MKCIFFVNSFNSSIYDQVRHIMLTDAIDQHDPMHLNKQQPAFLVKQRYVPLSEQQKMELPDLKPPVQSDPHRIATQSIPFVSTSGALGGLAYDNTSLTDSVKMEPDNDLIDCKVEFIDMDAASSYEEDAGPSPELDSSVAPKPDINEPVPETVTVPQKTKSKSRKAKLITYSESYLEETVNQIRNGTLLLYTAAKLTGIPRATLQYRLSSVFKNKGTRGPYSIFSTNEEKEIVKWIKDMVRKGFPITKSRIEYKVSNYLKTHPRKTPFKDNKPGKSWSKCFIKRNPDLSITKHLNGKVTEKDIRNWFLSILSYLEDNQLTDILKDPSRILNANEAGFVLHSTSKGVVDWLHKKNVSFIETTNGDHNMTVMFTFIANGSFVPPDVVLPMKRLTQKIKQSFPCDWGLGTSDNGWLDVRNFTLYIIKVLYPTLVKRGTQFPVLYFVDGHKSEIAFEAADMCKQYGIILIALYPNAAQIFQQSNVAAFKPLKTTWTRIVKTWRLAHKTKRMTLVTFASFLEEAMYKSLKKSTITNGFTVCGLYPFNSNAIDFKEYCRVFAANPASSNEGIAYNSNITDDTEEMPCDSGGTIGIRDESQDRQIEVPENALKTALRMLGPSKINLYQTTLADDLSHEDKVLSYVYKNILILGESPAHDVIQEFANNPSTSKAVGISKPTSLAPDADTLSPEFDVTMDIKVENDSEESTDMIVGGCDYDQENAHHSDKTSGKVVEGTSTSGNCQQNEIKWNYAG
ncbi:uncharacterized protein LOC135698251 [Ochlerotatus camptorhynchus]|uniref:uncharacterized protein LOC135698251 n=1 Tax=Ochlerotatus camptorhynchus TaxID=644619 RepID=UPI0031E3920E